jgi:hypothetical protein
MNLALVEAAKSIKNAVVTKRMCIFRMEIDAEAGATNFYGV